MSERVRVAAEKYARWRGFFEQRLHGSDAEVDAAMEAAMGALERGADVNTIVAAGDAGARAFRSDGRLLRGPSLERSQHLDRSVTPAAPTVVGSPTSGVVTAMQQRQEMYNRKSFIVWNFRLQRTNASGESLVPIPVEMRGRRFIGAISNGDLVDVGKVSKPGKIVQVRRVRNETVGADVIAVGKRHPVAQTFGILFVIAFFLAWVFFAYQMFGR